MPSFCFLSNLWAVPPSAFLNDNTIIAHHAAFAPNKSEQQQGFFVRASSLSHYSDNAETTALENE